MFAPKTNDLQDLGSGLLQAANREKQREENLQTLLEKTIKIKRLVKDILVLIDKGSRRSISDKQRKALETKVNKKMDELRALDLERTKTYLKAKGILEKQSGAAYAANFTFLKPE